jgi:RNA polymerase sigma-70 factor (ECF subfamily)
MSPGPEEREDAVLLRAVARGDEQALTILYDRHAGWLTVRLTRRCGRPDVVDQAVQDTFLAVWRGAERYRGGGDVAAFIWGIGVRRLIDAIRRDTGARRRLPWRAAEPELVVSAEDQALAGIEHGHLGQALAALSPELRGALALTCWARLRIMAHTIPPGSHPPAVYPLIAQLTGWCAVTVAAAACVDRSRYADLGGATAVPVSLVAIALAWYVPVTQRFLVEPPATAGAVTIAWSAIATAALALAGAAMRDQWHRYTRRR